MDYYYDDKGNRTADCLYNGTSSRNPIATYQYDYNNLLIESTSYISDPVGQTLEFNYGPDNQRYRKFDQVNNEITLYANKDYERIYKNSFLREQKYYITSYLTLTKVNQTGELKKNFMQKDRLGSTTQILDKNGDVLHTKSYDAFGKPRNGDWTDTANLFQAKLDFSNPDGTIDLTKRGFTDHEHLDEMQLIHMNGRMYDYNNGRFLSVDPFIQSPTSTQSMNPYTYIFNNPLSGVDPTGYISDFTPSYGLDRETRQALNEATSDFVDDSVEVLDKIDTASDFINPLKGLSKKAIKTGFKFLKNKVKKLFRNPKTTRIKNRSAKSNGNKNKSQITTTTKNKDISKTETINNKPETQSSKINSDNEKTYHRLGDSPENIKKIEQTGELRGNPATNTYASDIPKVKAYDGPLPKGKEGFEFKTTAKPDSGGKPGQPTWSGGTDSSGKVINPDVKLDNGQAVISCTVTGKSCN